MMSLIIWCIVVVGILILIHDAMMLGFFGRVAQNYAFNGSVNESCNRQVLINLVEISNDRDSYRVVEFSNINIEGEKQDFLAIQDPRPNRYDEYLEHYIFDVTGTPTTNPKYGTRYDRWSTSSKVLELMVDGHLNLSINTKDRLRELHMSIREPKTDELGSTETNTDKFRLFKKKVVHLS